jgi:hypothetical protein
MLPAERAYSVACNDIPKVVVDSVARQLKFGAALLTQYGWERRIMQGHRTYIWEHLSFCETTILNMEEMKSWLLTETLASDQNMKYLKTGVIGRFRNLKIELLGVDHLERLIRSAGTTYERTFFAETIRHLPSLVRVLLDDHPCA